MGRLRFKEVGYLAQGPRAIGVCTGFSIAQFQSGDRGPQVGQWVQGRGCLESDSLGKSRRAAWRLLETRVGPL